MQVVAVEQNGEAEATEKTGRTGGLPFIGKGIYRTVLEVPDTTSRTITLVFDGVMSNADVTLNGKRSFLGHTDTIRSMPLSMVLQFPEKTILRLPVRTKTGSLAGIPSGYLSQCPCCEYR